MDSVISSASPTRGPDFSEAVDASLKIDMLVRPWTSSQRDFNASDTGESNLQPGLLALIEDVVAARRATLLLVKDLIYISGFQQPAEAAVAARQIQTAVQGFRRRHSATPVAVSIAIDASRSSSENGDATSSDAAEPSHELISLLRISKPAQILMTHDALQQLSGSAGLPLKPFPGRFGVQEYFWTSEDQLEVLKSEPQLTLAIITRETTVPVSAPLPADAVSATFSAPEPPIHLGRSTRFSELALASRGASLLRSPRVWGMVGVPVVVVALIVGFIVSRGPSHPPAASSRPSISGNAPRVVPATSPASVPSDSTATTPPAPKVPGKTMSRPSPTQAAAANGGPPSKSKTQSRPAVTAPAAASVVPPAQTAPCLERGDPAALYSLAEQNRLRGDYSDAERNFRDLLDCAPNYPQARDGLERTLQAEKLHPK